MTQKLSANFDEAQLETIRRVQAECRYATLAAALRAIVDRYARAPIVAEIRLPGDTEEMQIILQQIRYRLKTQYEPEVRDE